MRLFPMYLTPLETFFFVDDRSSHPMAFVIQMRFTGQVNRIALEGTLSTALERHPLLQAVIERGKRRELCWVGSSELPSLDWGSANEPLNCQHGERIDLRHEVGLRVWIRQGESEANVTMQFHHACCDGIGAYRFIADWFALYGQETVLGPDRPELQPIDLSLLRIRKMRSTDKAYRDNGKEVSRRAWEDYRQHYGWRNRPQKLARPSTSARPAIKSPFPAIYSYNFTRFEHDQLRSAALQAGANVNDVLMAELFRTMALWNQKQGTKNPNQLLRMMIPTDLRNTQDYDMPATNIVGFVFLSRRSHDCVDIDTLLPQICQESQRIQQHREGARFIDTLVAAADFSKWFLPFLLCGETCTATAVLSNVGDPAKRFTARFPRVGGRVVMGNLVLEQITGVPPMRPGTRVSISIFSYLRQLTISVRCDPRYFGLEDTRDLTYLYADQLRGWMSTETQND